jgi:hypothetical protein
MIKNYIFSIKKLINRNIDFLFFFIWILCFHFHFILSVKLFFYRELLSIFFIFLSIFYLLKNNINLKDIFFNKEIKVFFLYLIFFLILIYNATANIDPDFLRIRETKNFFINKNIILIYVIRNFIIFMPVVFYFYLRGMTNQVIYKFLNIFLLVGFLGHVIKNFLFHLNNDINLCITINFFRAYGENNTYGLIIPYLFTISYFLFLKERKHFLRVYYFFLFLYFYIFIILSAGKAIILFAFLSFIFFSFIYFKKFKIGNIFFFLSLIFSVNFFSYFSSKLLYSNYCAAQTSPGFVSRFYQYKTLPMEIELQIFNDVFLKSIDARKEMYNEFYADPNLKKNLLLGSNSLLYLYSGPHNDYLRHLQRTGLIGTIASFFPIIYLFYFFLLKSYRKFIFNENSSLVYIFLVGIGTVLYYSLFVYPREDVYASGIFWFSLIIIYGYLNNQKKINEKKNTNNSGHKT